jgi:NAD(P)-dependent dehydrogenase (short-subunit alcohol dehydrogenase family)
MLIVFGIGHIAKLNLKEIHHRHRAIRTRSRSRRVALIYDARSAYDNKVMAGVAKYIHESAGWNVYIKENALKDQRLPDLETWKGDGIIADFDHPRVAAAVFKSRLPAVGLGTPEEIAQASLYLASNDSAFMTGQAFVIDGGWSI